MALRNHELHATNDDASDSSCFISFSIKTEIKFCFSLLVSTQPIAKQQDNIVTLYNK